MAIQQGDYIVGSADPIRIVPLHVPRDIVTYRGDVPALPNAQLTYRGGPLIGAVDVFTIFWGDAWSQQAQLMDYVNGFFGFIVTSPLMDQLAEYSVSGGTTIGQGTFRGTTTLTTPTLGQSVTDATIRQQLQQEISSNSAFPQPTGNTLYFVFLPPGVLVVMGGSSSCQAFCGYHNDINGQIFYAAMPYPNCNGCLGGLSTQDALTSISSHELCESITDPVPGQGWYDDANGEIGDICAWQTKKVGTYTVQLEWSNQANACV
jgi:hypothetical protein